MPILLLFFQACYLAISFLSSTSHAKAATTSEMSLYLQDYSYSGGKNSTSVSVAGVSGNPRHFTEFGTVYVSDDPITLTPDPDSARVGRSQGTYVVAGSDGRNLQVVLSLVFNNGSTIQIQGSYRQFEVGSEVSVVGGTGIFRLARGYATFETCSYHPSSNPNIPSHGVLRLNVTLVQAQC